MGRVGGLYIFASTRDDLVIWRECIYWRTYRYSGNCFFGTLYIEIAVELIYPHYR
jgi:hypothetical protein